MPITTIDGDRKVQRMTKRVADVLIETLEAAGVKTCYGIVGDTLNQIAHAIDRSEIDWVHMRHEEAGAFAAQAEAQLTGRLTACAGSCGPGSLHFINGLYEANRNRAPVILIASQIIRKDIGFEAIQEVDFQQVYQGCSVYCEMILTPEQARRKAVAACQAALTRRGVAVLIVPVDISTPPRLTNCPMPFMRRARSSGRAMRTSTRWRPFSTEASPLRSTQAQAARARMTRWSPSLRA
jgi:pyruvate dehydrogenase (quinone)